MPTKKVLLPHRPEVLGVPIPYFSTIYLKSILISYRSKIYQAPGIWIWYSTLIFHTVVTVVYCCTWSVPGTRYLSRQTCSDLLRRIDRRECSIWSEVEHARRESPWCLNPVSSCLVLCGAAVPAGIFQGTDTYLASRFLKALKFTVSGA